MISITQHKLSPWELVRRRLEAVHGCYLHEGEAFPAFGSPRRFLAGEEIFPADGSSMDALVVVSGVAAEARFLTKERRQIFGLKLPGDVVLGDAHEALVAQTEVLTIDALPFLRMLNDPGSQRTDLRRAWVAAARAEQHMLRDQIVRLGRLSAYERMAHFLVETHERLLHVGLASPADFHLPLRQDVVSDILGISVVHLSRVTQELRRDGLIQLRSGYVSFIDRKKAAEIAAYESRFSVEPPSTRETPPSQSRPRSSSAFAL